MADIASRGGAPRGPNGIPCAGGRGAYAPGGLRRLPFGKAVALKTQASRAPHPLDAFIHDAGAGSLILFACAMVALFLGNSPWSSGYQDLVSVYAKIEIGTFSVEGTLQQWVNDGLMVLFFFVLGLEIKREILVGELKDVRRAFPVVVAALGGMLVPALIYAAFNAGTPAIRGWGVPMATDTAFVIGVLTLVGSQGKAAIAGFLTALAILDDIGAIPVIALFYAQDVSPPHLIVAGGVFVSLIVLNLVGVRRPGAICSEELFFGWHSYLRAGARVRETRAPATVRYVHFGGRRSACRRRPSAACGGSRRRRRCSAGSAHWNGRLRYSYCRCSRS